LLNLLDCHHFITVNSLESDSVLFDKFFVFWAAAHKEMYNNRLGQDIFPTKFLVLLNYVLYRMDFLHIAAQLF
jgi:hypothetical protein